MRGVLKPTCWVVGHTVRLVEHERAHGDIGAYTFEEKRCRICGEHLGIKTSGASRQTGNRNF